MNKENRSTWSLVWVLAKTDFRLRYQGSVLGFLWALLKPLALFAVLLVVFSTFFSAEVPFYPLQLLTALLLWMFFAEGTMLGLTSMQSKAHVLKKIFFPRHVVVLAAVLQAFLTFITHLLILFVVIAFSSFDVGLFHVLGFFLICFLVLLLTLTFSIWTAPLYIRFRDLHQIWDVLLLVGFYTAPILFPMAAMSESVQRWLYLNPMTSLVMEAKSVLFLGEWADSTALLRYAFILFIVLLFGIFFFQRSQARAVELL
jgi:ABC-type polysaccharide/polyol phosphate export permease